MHYFQIDIELRADLTRHQRTVSVVRFSHTGEILASGDDEANIILWKLQSSFDGAPQLFDASENKENWQVYKVINQLRLLERLIRRRRCTSKVCL